MSLNWLFADMDAFFASAEQYLQPQWRGRPLGVIPIETDFTCVIAASYEAKRCGVKTGTGVREARRLCPEIGFVKARPETYVEIHDRLLQCVETCAPVHRVYSIDEWTVQLRGEERQPEHAHRLAQAIQQAMLREFGPWLTCSIGLASTRLLAKIASKLHKPRGLRVLADAELPQAIEHLPLDGLSGINRGIVARLHRHGIENVRRLWELDRDQLARIWGAVTGAQWWDGLHGVDQPEPPTRRRSMSNGHVLEPRFRAPESARSLLARLVCKLAQRLRRNRFCARRLQLQLLEESGAVWLDDIAVPRSQDTVTLLELFSILWQRRQGGFRHIKKVNVCVAGLEPASQVPRSLFEEDEKRQRLSHTIDAINHRQGEFKVYFGTLHDYRQPMEDKIAFGRIPRKETP